MTRFRTLFLVAVVAWLFPTEALANTYKFCVRMDTALENVNFGEDRMLDADGPYVASYLKYRITYNGATVAPTGYLPSSGCVTFSHSSKGQFKMELWSEMRIPRSDNSSYYNTVRIKHSNGTLAWWAYYWTFGGTTGTATFTFNQTRRTNLIAMSRYIIQRISDGANYKIYDVWDKASSSCPDNSCNGSYSSATNTATVYINPIHNGRKFLVGHELGHAHVAHWFNYNPGFGDMYSRNEGGSFCTWSGAGAHSIHSKEYSSAALIEGYPHYFATYAFNYVASYAGFWYYKDGTGVTEVNMENGNTGGTTRFMETNCTGSHNGRGVELDWARQFWDFRTNPGAKPSNYAILRMIKNSLLSGWTNTNTYSKMQGGVSTYDSQNGTSFLSRWNDFGAYNGIDH